MAGEQISRSWRATSTWRARQRLSRARPGARLLRFRALMRFCKVSRIYFRADAGFANPDVYEYLEAERIKYAIRLPANRVLQERTSEWRILVKWRLAQEVRNIG